MNDKSKSRIRVGLAAAAFVGATALTVGCSATGGSLADQIQPAAHVVNAARTVKTTPDSKPNPANADKISEITATITNNTDMTLTKVSATHTGTGVHWQQQAPGTLAPHSSTTVTDYAGGNNEIDMTYQDASGATYTFDVDDPFSSKDSVKGSTTSRSFGISASAGSGLKDNSSFTVYAGQSFGLSGSTQQYVVPAGVTALNVDVIGGSGGEDNQTINGADIVGTMAVTPGEVLTVGVGGKGHDGGNDYSGGFGLPWNGSSFSGGSGLYDTNSNPAQPQWGGGGGGASVIANGNQLLVVAGGGGGEGGNDGVYALGGRGGYNGSLTGQDGEYHGGMAGSQSAPAGQSSLYGAGQVGGAGGGGYAGGGSGLIIDQEGGGGGAGSSYDAGLNAGATVSTASGNTQDGSINLTAVTN